MNQAWDAERVVDAALARQLIERQFPDLAPARVELLGAGWDNTAFTVNGGLVFRFPRRQIAVPFLEAECRILPGLAGRLPVAIPEPLMIGSPTPAWPWLFAGYRRLPGRTLCSLEPSAGQRLALAEPLAHVLAALHGISSADARALGAGPDPIARLDVRRRAGRMDERLAALQGVGLCDSGAILAGIVAAVEGDAPPDGQTLVHGDLYARHLLVDGEARLTGIIDWGDVHLGDPAVDLSVAHALFPPAARELFRAAYGPIGERTWRFARFRALDSTLAIVTYARAIGDADLLRAGRLALAHLAMD